jgi:hypothetical protein
MSGRRRACAATTSPRSARHEAALLLRLRGVLCPSRKTAAAVESYGVSPDRIAIVEMLIIHSSEPGRRGNQFLEYDFFEFFKPSAVFSARSTAPPVID